jgi:hypothetical protein
MFLNSLDRKPLFKKEDGNIIRDLTQSIFDFKSGNFINYQAYRVPMEYQMRCDLISQAVYNNTIYSEYILKFNGISNPFTISNGDVILIPDLNSAKQNVKQEQEAAGDNAESKIRKSYKYLDPTKAPTTDPNAVKFDNRDLQNNPGGTAAANGKGLNELAFEEALPPNIAAEGQNQVTYRNGRVYFGEGIGQSACLQNGMSSGEFLTQIIKNRKV